MEHVSLLALPLAALAALVLIGAGPAVLLGARLPLDAQAALAPLCGAASLAAFSPLVPLGLPIEAVALFLLPLALLAVPLRARVRTALRSGARPLGAALGALLLAAIPSLARGNWTVSSHGNADLYFWVSQARGLLDGPAAPAHPDRVAYERIATEGWSAALPVGNGLLSMLADADPAQVYGALAALIVVLVPLAGYFCARACLEWSPGRSLLVAALLAVNANLLFAAYYGWHGQILGTAFVLAAATALRLALDPGAPIRYAALGGLFAAAALASYRLPIAPYLGLTLVSVVVSYVVWERRRSGPILHALGSFGVATALLALPSFVALVDGLPRFVGRQLFETGWILFPRNAVGQALGLVPPAFGPSQTTPVGLRAAAAILILGAVAIGLHVALRTRQPRADFLVGSAVLVGFGALVLSLPAFSPYLALKLLGYATPALALLVLASLVQKPGFLGRTLGALGAAAILATTVVTVERAVRLTGGPGVLAGLAETEPQIPAGAVVEVDVADAWRQSWAIYYLRDVRLSVPKPSEYLTGFGLDVPADAFVREPVAYRLGPGTKADALWIGAGLSLAPVASTAVRRSPSGPVLPAATRVSSACCSRSGGSARG